MPFMRLSSVPRVRVVGLPLSFVLGFLSGIYLFTPTSTPTPYTHNIMPLQTNFNINFISTNSVLYAKESADCPSPLKLIFIILSSPYDVPKREAIRKTWLQFYKNLQRVKIVSKFVIGTKSVTQDLMDRLKAEALYNDIIYLHDLEDSFDNLTSKLLSSLVWAYDNHNFDFLIKCDSDSFVQIDRLVEALHKMKCPSLFYWGYFNGMGYPDYNGKWSEKQWFLCPHFVPYAVGGGYVLSQQVVRLIVSMKEGLSLYKNEDVSLGLWLAPFDIQRFHDIRFNTEGHSHGCNNNYIISHKEKVATFIQKRKNLMTNRTICKTESEFKPAYIYNWNVTPPLCCQRKFGIRVPR